MEFRVGERVRLLHENQDVTITEILGKKKYLVLDDDGFDYEVFQKEIVKIHDSESHFSTVSDQAHIPTTATDPLLLVTKPDNNAPGLWMLNPTKKELVFTLHVKIKSNLKPFARGVIGIQEKKYLGSLSLEEYSFFRGVSFQFFEFEPEASKPEGGIYRELIWNEKAFNGEAEFLNALNREGFAFSLAEEELDIEEPEPQWEKYEKRDQVPKPIIDLHIEELVEDFEKLSPTRMLQIQLSKFESEMNQAIMLGAPGIIFIHGIGKGTLKNEIRERLSNYPHVRTFFPGEEKKFGEGATEIRF